jgi:virulence factor Mce-like protein
MKRVLLSGALLLAVGAFVVLAGGASNSSSAGGSYKVELDNAFGLTPGTQFKVAGVPAGSVKTIELCEKDTQAKCQNPLHAVVTVQVTQKGFGQFRSDAFCQSRPQSLIGEYFIDCQPGQRGRILPADSTIPVSHTQSTIPADLLGNVMRMPYRQRFTLIINELGAAVAGRSGDLQAALRRAVPALTQTDRLLNLLANDSSTLQSLTVNSDAVITALANNSAQVQRFIVEAKRAATDTAAQDNNLRLTLQKFPGFLEQLKPTMARLSQAAVANDPVVKNLDSAAVELHRLFTNLAPCSQPHQANQCGFADASRPALKSLGQASLTGTPAMIAARPTVYHLNQFAKPTPELAHNLAIVLQDLDTQQRSVEPDTRSPGGKGYSGLQALLQYVFNQPLAINAYSNFGHMLTVDAFIDPRCAPYATPQKIANNLAQSGPSYRQCYSWLGPNQQGINVPDPSNPGGCVPDPGGAPPGRPGPKTSACKLAANPTASVATDVSNNNAGGSTPAAGSNSSNAPPGSSPSASGGGAAPKSSGSPGVDLPQALGQIFSSLGGKSANTPASPSTAVATSSAAGGSPSAPSQAKQLLNYLLAP